MHNMSSMIDSHFHLSCYALQSPFKAYYSFTAHMIELIDINNDVYQFRMPDYEHYEKMAANCAIKQYFRYYSTSFILHQRNVLIVQNNGGAAASIDNVAEFAVTSTPDSITVFLVPHSQELESTLKIRAVVINKSKKELSYFTQPKTFLLLNGSQLENYNFQKLVGESSLQNGKIQHVFGHYCLMRHKQGIYSVVQFDMDSKEKIESKVLKYEIVSCQFPRITKLLGTYQNTIAFVSQTHHQEKSQKTQGEVCILNGQNREVIQLKGLNSENAKLEYFICKKVVFVLEKTQLLLYSLAKGILLAKIEIAPILQQLQEGSSIMVGQQTKKQQRYCLLMDYLVPNSTNFYLIDKQKMTIFNFNIEKLLQHFLIGPISSTIADLTNDKDQIHLNVMKTLNFRTKKLNTLQEYLNQAMKTLSFGHVLRFLQNQDNIFVLNDGLFLLFKAVENNVDLLIKQKGFISNLQRDLVELCIKLISDSKYEDHLLKGLTIAKSLFSMLRTNLKTLKSNENLQAYAKLLESKRAIRLLKQDKNKQLFQVCYQLAISVKGYDYLEQLEKKKN